MKNELTTQSFVGEWQVMKEQAAMLLKSNFLPESIKTSEQAIAIMMKGKEIGMQPMQALGQINIIKGKPCISAEGMLALVFKCYPGTKLDYIENDDKICVIEVTKPGGSVNSFTFSFEDAVKAGITGNPTWGKYRRAMLRSRCISEMCRSMFPDAIQGCSYTPDEIKEQEYIEISPPQLQSVKPIDLSPQQQSIPFFDPTNSKQVGDLTTALGEKRKHLIQRVCELLSGKPWDRENLKMAVAKADREEIMLEHPDAVEV